MQVVTGEMTECTNALAESFELVDGWERTREQQICDLFVAETVFALGVGHEFVDLIAAQAQLALVGDYASVDLFVAVHVRDAREAGDHARTVRIAQAALDVVFDKEVLVIGLGGKTVVELLAVGVDLAARLVIENETAQIVVKTVIDSFGVVCHGLPPFACAAFAVWADYRRYMKLKTSSRWMVTVTPESSPASERAF